MNAKNIKVDIWSDFVCPFCYIGRKKFEEALKETDLWGKVEMNYRSLELDPTKERNKEADPVQQFADKYEMPLGKAQRIMEKTQAKVEAEGLSYNYNKTVAANTFNAHRLNYYAKEFGKSEEVTTKILNGHFAKSLDIGDLEVLSKIGEDVGLNKDEIMKMFHSNQYYLEIENDRKMAEKLNVDLVPTYIINDKHRISGILSSEDYLELLKKVKEED
ncbi:MAG TPA: DsbA family oxidoreductase [Epulopiscium sp.]|nr:DsbA family oxidoreductase [Candidatus Epulonipiscium sp.]